VLDRRGREGGSEYGTKKAKSDRGKTPLKHNPTIHPVHIIYEGAKKKAREAHPRNKKKGNCLGETLWRRFGTLYKRHPQLESKSLKDGLKQRKSTSRPEKSMHVQLHADARSTEDTE